MVGGGPGAFIGAVHRMAAALDGHIELVAGAFSSDPGRSAAQGRELGLDDSRVYATFAEMAAAEAALPADERIHFVAIVTPNHLHFEPARVFLEAGFDVVCDKPLTTSLDDAYALCDLVRERDAVFAVTHNYTGYPMVREARAWVRAGRLGTIRKVIVEYVQGWLATPLEEDGQKQADWRTDPERAGAAGALGDIGTHAHNLVGYVTGLEIEALAGDLTTFVEGRRLEDDASLLMRFRGGARGTLTASQICVGEENGLTLRVYGTDGALAWRQESPERLIFRPLDGPRQVHRRGHGYLGEAAAVATRLPAGHPEGFIEAFANIYRAAAGSIAARQAGREPTPAERDYPTVFDGARGMHFLERAVEAGRTDGWVDATYDGPA
ncbi:MAG: Gfo/Idh/MocA family oxidoreductase [Gemmatimonadota bacterium]|nr:Gfo/Idh/MocA family oxidoreductase [Gemmatimonadota bacterium]